MQEMTDVTQQQHEMVPHIYVFEPGYNASGIFLMGQDIFFIPFQTFSKRNQMSPLKKLLKRRRNTISRGLSHKNVMQELQVYRNLPSISMTEDSARWWLKNRSTFPILFRSVSQMNMCARIINPIGEVVFTSEPSGLRSFLRMLTCFFSSCTGTVLLICYQHFFTFS